MNKLKVRVPFAVIGSAKVHKIDGKKFRGQKFPRCLVEVKNLELFDFVVLRIMLLRTHLQDIK